MTRKPTYSELILIPRHAFRFLQLFAGQGIPNAFVNEALGERLGVLIQRINAFQNGILAVFLCQRVQGVALALHFAFFRLQTAPRHTF